jgi:hypothetical protein
VGVQPAAPDAPLDAAAGPDDEAPDDEAPAGELDESDDEAAVEVPEEEAVDALSEDDDSPLAFDVEEDFPLRLSVL